MVKIAIGIPTGSGLPRRKFFWQTEPALFVPPDFRKAVSWEWQMFGSPSFAKNEDLGDGILDLELFQLGTTGG
jgi:hypothetical protein